jgi:hypothetical protein
LTVFSNSSTNAVTSLVMVSVSFTGAAARSSAGSSDFDRAYHGITVGTGIIKKQFRDFDHQYKLDKSWTFC